MPVHVIVCLVDPNAGFTAFLFYKLQIHKGRAEFEQNNTNINKLTYRIYNMRVQQETEENWGLKHTWGKHEAKYTGWNTAGNTGEPKLTKETGEAKLKISAQDRGVTK